MTTYYLLSPSHTVLAGDEQSSPSGWVRAEKEFVGQPAGEQRLFRRKASQDISLPGEEDKR